MGEASNISYSLKNCKVGVLRGKGSVGSVYEAVTQDGKIVAVKIMEETPFIESNMLQSILDGALETQKLPRKAKVVKIYTTGKEKNKYYILMDLYAGTLEKLIAQKSSSLQQKLSIAFLLAETLKYVHGDGLVHGDLKPSNVLLDDNMEL